MESTYKDLTDPDNIIYTVDGHTGKAEINWKNVAKVANIPIPSPPDNFSLINMYNVRFNQIHNCRLLLSARQEVWIEAGKDPQDNPWPPVPLNQWGDFKTEFRMEIKDGRGRYL